MTDEEPTSRSRMLTHGSPGMCGSGNAQTDQGSHQLARRRLGIGSFRSASHPLEVNQILTLAQGAIERKT